MTREKKRGYLLDMDEAYTQEIEEQKTQIQKGFALKNEAFEILKLINAEFQSDPLSVQCFDLRIVQRLNALILEYEELDN